MLGFFILKQKNVLFAKNLNICRHTVPVYYYLVCWAEPKHSSGRVSIGNALEGKVGGAVSGHTLPPSAGSRPE